MFCSSCGTKNPESYKFCSKCGAGMTAMPAAAPAQTSSAPVEAAPAPSSAPAALSAEALSNLYVETAPPKSGLSPAWKRALTVGAIILIGNILWFGARPYLIGVTMDAAFVESNIESKYADNGLSVTVVCPDPFIARPGESRDCLVTEDLLGLETMVTVTVTNANGDFSWISQ